MKKLLVLMLVLGMASLANAALILTVPGTVDVAVGTYSVTLSGAAGDILEGGVYASPFPSDVAATGATVTGRLGNLGGTTAYDDGYFDGWEIVVKELNPAAGDEITAEWSVEYTGIAVGADSVILL